MTRPLRIEFPGALYHVTARGDRNASIFLDDGDRFQWLRILDSVCSRYNVLVHAFCQMSNHYHIMMETVDGNLAQAMRSLNARYTQYFNRRHGMAGHVLQGRYHAILVQKESHLLECARYVVLNPVRAGMVRLPEQWPWSSFNYVGNGDEPPPWLSIVWLLAQFGPDVATARTAYCDFVREGIGAANPFDDTKHRVILGDDTFTRGHAERLLDVDLSSVVKDQRRMRACSLHEYAMRYLNREEAMARAYHSTAFTLAEIGKYFGVHGQTVGRAVKEFSTAAPDWDSVRLDGPDNPDAFPLE